MSNIINVLEERGFIEAMTGEELRIACQKPIKLYCGFDPTSDSLHLGNMVAIMGLAWFQKFGHTPYVIVGGATGMIGDPSGKSEERNLLDPESIAKNLEGIKKNLAQILDFKQAVILNNYDWFKDYSFITFLRDIGKSFRLGPMLAKESVRTRVNSEEGMSFTEFSYQLLQAYDYLYLHQRFDVTLQIGGSDQWGNITAGKDLIRKTGGGETYGLTFPLLTTSDGKKFGKSEKGAIWLSPEKLSPYEFYQYLVRTSDADVIKLMKMLTFMDIQEIREYEKKMAAPEYIPNTAQKRLAEEVTRIVHGEEALGKALKATSAAAPGSKAVLDAESLESISADIPNKSLKKSELIGIKLIELIVNASILSSKGEARKMIQNGGVSINNNKVLDENYIVSSENLIDEKLMLLSVGKKNKLLFRVTA